MNTHHKIWRIAGPMILANISVPLLGLVDAAILGHLDSPVYLAAVGVGASLLTLTYWAFGFLRMGTTGASAQARGSQNAEQRSRVWLQSAVLALALAAMIVLIAPHLVEFAVAVMKTPQASVPAAQSYLQIRLASAPAVLLTYVTVGWLIGQQKTHWALAISLTTNGLNIALDYALILGAGLNSDGAAIASVISEYCGAAMGVFAVRSAFTGVSAPLIGRIVTRWSDYRAVLQSNGALFIRTAALLLSLAFFTAQSAAFGADVLAANTLLINLMFLSSHALDGFAHAAEALAGEAVGRKNHRQFLRVCQRCAVWCFAAGALISLGLASGKPWIAGLLTDIDAVAAETDRYFFWLAALPLISTASYLLDGIFVGALQTRWMQHTMLVSVVGVYLPVWYWSQVWGNHGLWLAFLALNAARGLLLAGTYWHLNRRRAWW